MSLLVAFGALVAALVAFNLFLGLGYDARPRPFLASDIAIGLCFALAGLAAWRLRPRSRTGAWMLTSGIVNLTSNPSGFELPRQLPGYDLIMLLAGDLYWLQFAVGGQLLLSYPSGRLRHGSPERVLVAASFLLAIVGGACVQALQLARSPAYTGTRTLVMVAWVVLATGAAGLLIRRILRSTPRQRRKDGFGLAAAGTAVAVFAGIFIVLLAVFGVTDNGPSSQHQGV